MDPNVSAQLLEYDKRFEQYGSDFTFYDYNHPEELPSELKNSYKVIVADPPYLVRVNCINFTYFNLVIYFHDLYLLFYSTYANCLCTCNLMFFLCEKCFLNLIS